MQGFVLLFRNSFKRMMDFVIALAGLILLAPFFAVVSLRIKRETRGEVFYSSIRVGRGGKPFLIHKFTTMQEDEKGDGAVPVTAADDPRVTPLGRWLRDTKINELPQLWNVLKGEMSLVGPRPEAPEIVAQWPEEVRREILSVRPGITSPASILYRHEEKMLKAATVMDEYLGRILPDKLRLDLLYVRTSTILCDLDVLIWTVMVLFWPEPISRRVPEARLFYGPVNRFIKRYFSWFVIDFLVALTGIAVAGFLTRVTTPLNLGLPLDILIAILAAIFFSSFNALMGLGRVAWHTARPAYAFDLALSNLLTTLLLLALNKFLPGGPFLPAEVYLIAGLFTFLGFLISRYRTRLLTGLAWRWLQLRSGQGMLGERVLIVGAGECGQMAAWLLQKSGFSPAFWITGMVDDSPSLQGLKVEGFTVLGTTADIPRIVREKNIGVILFAIATIEKAARERILSICRGLPVRVVIVPDLLDAFRKQMEQATIWEDHVASSEG